MGAFDPAAITAAILAGGAGRRVGGADKGLLLLDGRPLIMHVQAALHGQAGAIVICANRNADRYARFAPVVTDATADFRGPLAGIAAALGHCKSEWLLTVPVDCPSPPSDFARRLQAAADGHAAVAYDGRCRQPLFAIYRRGLFDSAAAALARSVSVWGWQDEIGARMADFSDAPQIQANLNTHEDFKNWEQVSHG
ncbi:MAG: molybdenum cofactor guanylyltransferase [Xanthomonadaceae bacterium]|nr:molybdenum cofactor guanylyltransferase [Xanthomonadaceae bacterium]MDE1884494.1 molybdenum cofactor guanylyltransferase [Xanthomonadaceae bacterium]MDE1960671.1 molybdenum cofactor guanylyltransferase [Xanthomonadaceae bacterium]MDE2083632.1 molybdenum cofactor guanylyltransferase [Xanthomonadaceae bacterium]